MKKELIILIIIMLALAACNSERPKQIILADSMVCDTTGSFNICSGRRSYISMEIAPDSGRIHIDGDTISAIKHLWDYTLKMQAKLDSIKAELIEIRNHRPLYKQNYQTNNKL